MLRLEEELKIVRIGSFKRREILSNKLLFLYLNMQDQSKKSSGGDKRNLYLLAIYFFK